MNIAFAAIWLERAQSGAKKQVADQIVSEVEPLPLLCESHMDDKDDHRGDDRTGNRN